MSLLQSKVGLTSPATSMATRRSSRGRDVAEAAARRLAAAAGALAPGDPEAPGHERLDT